MTFSSFLIRVLLILVIPAIVALSTYRFMQNAFVEPKNAGSTEKIVIEIAPGKTFREICSLLQAKGVVSHAWALNLLARLRKTDTKIHAGEYELSPSMEPRVVLAKLMSGDVVKRQVTIKEGASIWEVGRLLDNAGIISADEFDRAISDPKLLAKAGISAASFEGYLFPETYQFSRPVKAEEIIWRMLEEGERRWPSHYSNRADELKMSRHEILILASIVEKESGFVDEQPIISSVFHNRLGQGMKLQSDPTVIYGIKNFNGNLRKEDLMDGSNPYNTYMQYGLPPGPICNPGENAIRAALFPKETAFLFFVAEGTGKHVFSTTLQEHNEMVAKYQKNPAAAAAAASP